MTPPPKKKPPRRVNNYPYRHLSKALFRKSKRTGAPCWICGHPIDYGADWRSKWSFTADHVDPIALGGNPRGELRPAHRSCNSRRGDTRNNTEKLHVRKPAKKSRDW